jgi:hypothetical protein
MKGNESERKTTQGERKKDKRTWRKEGNREDGKEEEKGRKK